MGFGKDTKMNLKDSLTILEMKDVREYSLNKYAKIIWTHAWLQILQVNKMAATI